MLLVWLQPQFATMADVENWRKYCVNTVLFVAYLRSVDMLPSHTESQHLLFDPHHPLERNFIRILQHRAESVLTSVQAQEKEQEHLRVTLKAWGYLKWTFVKTAIKFRKSNNDVGDEEEKNEGNILFVSGLSAKLRRLFNKSPNNTTRQELVHTKDHTPKHNNSNMSLNADLLIKKAK